MSEVSREPGAKKCFRTNRIYAASCRNISMERRNFLRTVILGGGALSGCLSRDTDHSRIRNQSTETGTSTRDRRPKPRVSLAVVDRQWPVPEETIRGKFDCGELTAIITGWTRPPSACRRLTVESVRYSKGPDEVSITLGSRRRRTNDNATCEGVAYKFRLALRFEDELPKTVVLRYDSPENGSEKVSPIRNNSC